ncbi:hypothetical protein Syun_015246 [Stephania yunnanensis]|uniref:F-box domain-containing protein n=1 Tax=Stephania yunnanensis TaxID=152371 RepID=A0AAP0JLW3_9MAGN
MEERVQELEEINIEEEVIFQEIIPRLPVKSIFRFKSVCKKWRNYLSDPLFAKQHSMKSPDITSSGFICSHPNDSHLFMSRDDQFKWSKPASMTAETMEEETEKVACFGLQSKLTEDIIFEEILPRLPIKSIFRFKLVSQKWLNFITHDPLLPTHHSQKGPNTTNDITSSGLFCPRSQLFFSSDDHNHQFKWNKPEFMTGQPDEVLGCCNGLTYGMLPGYLKIFIFNPITKHTVYAPNLLNHSLGFTILAIHNDKRKFKLYSSKTGEWRVFGDDPWYPLPRYHQAQVLNLGFVE